MILFLHGEDAFRSRQKLNDIIARFKKSDPSDMNLVILDMSDKSMADFSKAITAAPFLGSKRLVIVKSLVSEAKADIQEEASQMIKNNKISPDTTLVLFEFKKVDKRKKLYKLLAKPKQSQEFKLLPEYEVSGWVRTEIKRRDGEIANDAVEKLASYVGNDLWKMDNEITKLLLYCHKQEIRSEDVETMVKAKLDENVFHLVDAIGAKDVKSSLKLLHDQFEQGEDAIRLLGMIAYQFRNLAQVCSLVEKNLPESEIKQQTGLHPFVIRKTMGQACRFPMSKIKKSYNMLVRTDLAMKRGRLDKKTALDLLVVGLCK